MSLYKIWLILRSEFWRRVRSKAFLLATLLVPFGFVIVAGAPVVLGYLAGQGGHDRIAVVDETGQLGEAVAATSDHRITFQPVDLSIDSVRTAVRAGTFEGYLLLPETLLEDGEEMFYYSMDGGGLTDRLQIDHRIGQTVQQERLRAVDAPEAVLSIVDADIDVTSRTLSEEGPETDHSLAYTVIGYSMALIIYFAVFIYGQLVMQGVIEEKSTRVVEIIVSSARPFELLMGKVLGIGAMGLLQMLVWGALAVGGLMAVAPLLAVVGAPSMLGITSGMSPTPLPEMIGGSLPAVPASLIVWFLLFFLGGFLLYASFFAAIGSAVERQQDAQYLLIPVMIPLLIPILLLAFVIESPNALLSVVLSFVPLFSPILMILRAAITTVPFWEMATAFALLVATFVGMIWGAGRIYRIGILSYGKTPGFRELLRWATYR